VGSPDIKQALLERLHGENQMKEKWTKLWYDPFEVPFEGDPLTLDKMR
jgi:hypothetical protein